MANNLIHNEQVKLTASFLNSMAVAIFFVLGAGPAVALSAKDPWALPPIGVAVSVLSLMLAGAIGSFIMHRIACRHLTALEE